MKTFTVYGLVAMSATVFLLNTSSVHGRDAEALDGLAAQGAATLNSGPVLGKPEWLPLNADGSYVKNLLTEAQRLELAKAFGIEEQVLKASPELTDALESVLHSKGSKYHTLSLANAASHLDTKTGHGALFELMCAQDDARRGLKVAFTGAGNMGTDHLVYPNGSTPMTFCQSKAWATAAGSAKEGLLDALAYAGGDRSRPGELISGKNAFRVVIPKDQFAELVKIGDLLEDGRPSSTFINGTLKMAAKEAQGTGASAGRIRATLPDAQAILERVAIKPGPVTYNELLLHGKVSAQSVRIAEQRVAIASVLKTAQSAQAVQAAKKAAGLAGGTKAAAEVVQNAGKLGKAGKALVGAGLLGSAAQAVNGVEELRQGNMVEGSAKLAGSATDATSSVAALAGKRVLSAGAGALGAGIDGGIDLYKGITEEDTKKAVVGGGKITGATVMAAGVATAQPEVVAAGAFIYGGAVVGEFISLNRGRTVTGPAAAEIESALKASAAETKANGRASGPTAERLAKALKAFDEQAKPAAGSASADPTKALLRAAAVLATGPSTNRQTVELGWFPTQIARLGAKK